MTGCFTFIVAMVLFFVGFVVFVLSQLCELVMYILDELAVML